MFVDEVAIGGVGAGGFAQILSKQGRGSVKRNTISPRAMTGIEKTMTEATAMMLRIQRYHCKAASTMLVTIEIVHCQALLRQEYASVV